MDDLMNELDLEDVRKISHYILGRTDNGKELRPIDQSIIEAGCDGTLTGLGVSYLMRMLHDVVRGTHPKLF